MSIKTIYSDEKKKGWIFDYKVKKYRGYLLDAYQYQGVDKPDKRRRLQFAHRQEAEAIEAAFTGEKRNARLSVMQVLLRISVFIDFCIFRNKIKAYVRLKNRVFCVFRGFSRALFRKDGNFWTLIF